MDKVLTFIAYGVIILVRLFTNPKSLIAMFKGDEAKTGTSEDRCVFTSYPQGSKSEAYVSIEQVKAMSKSLAQKAAAAEAETDNVRQLFFEFEGKALANAIKLRAKDVALRLHNQHGVPIDLTTQYVINALGQQYRDFRKVHIEVGGGLPKGFGEPEPEPEAVKRTQKYSSTEDLLDRSFRRMRHIVTERNFRLHAPEDYGQARLYVATIHKLHRRGFDVNFGLLDRIEDYCRYRQSIEVSFDDFVEQLKVA